MHLLPKILGVLFLLVEIQCADSFPQFSIPGISWSKNKEETSLNLNVQNIFSSPYRRTVNTGQHEKNRDSNEVVNKNQNIITVTPNPSYYLDYLKFYTTQGPQVWKNVEISRSVTEIINKNKVENFEKFVENEDHTANELDFKNSDVNTYEDYDATTESTTEYESTTYDDFDLANRVGFSSHVVASLLG